MFKFFIIIIFSALLLGITYYKFNKTEEFTTKQYLENEFIPVPKHAYEDLIKYINNNNNLIKNIVFDQISVKVKGVGLKALISYEKPYNFRMRIYYLSLESDIGANDKLFWFWSKRMNPSILYYGEHKNNYLKPMYNPYWIKDILGVSELKLTETVIIGEFLGLIERKNEYKKLTLIDLKNKVIIGHYLYKDETIIISCDIIKFQEYNNILIPKILKIYVKEKNMSIIWDLGEPKINTIINNDIFIIPDIKPKILLST